MILISRPYQSQKARTNPRSHNLKEGTKTATKQYHVKFVPHAPPFTIPELPTSTTTGTSIVLTTTTRIETIGAPFPSTIEMTYTFKHEYICDYTGLAHWHTFEEQSRTILHLESDLPLLQ